MATTNLPLQPLQVRHRMTSPPRMSPHSRFLPREASRSPQLRYADSVKQSEKKSNMKNTYLTYSKIMKKVTTGAVFKERALGLAVNRSTVKFQLLALVEEHAFNLLKSGRTNVRLPLRHFYQPHHVLLMPR